MTVKNFLKIGIAFLLVMFVLASCSKEKFDVQNEEDVVLRIANETGTTYDAEGTRKHFDCFTITFPVDVILPDGSTVTTNDLQELRTTIKDYYAANPNSTDKPTFAFPIELTFKDGTVSSITSVNELKMAFKSCRKKHDRKKCFSLEFPVTLILSDGTTTTVNDWKEFKDAVGMDRDFDFQFPINVTLADGTSESVVDEAALDILKEECKERYGHDKQRCFELNFPLTLILPDGTNETVNSWSEVKNLISHRDEFELQFPVDVTMDDGTVVTLNNETELEDLKNSCE